MIQKKWRKLEKKKATHWDPSWKSLLWAAELQKQKIVLFFEVNFMHNEMHRPSVYNLISFDKCKNLCNHYPKQDIEHFHHPWKFPCVISRQRFHFSPPPHRHPETTAVLISIATDSFACPWTLHTWNHTTCTFLCLAPFVQYNVWKVQLVMCINGSFFFIVEY